MGTDIDSFIEIRQPDGTWKHATGLGLTCEDQWDDPDEPFGGRNYSLFGFLADVRNRAESPVIMEPRGLPADVSPDVRKVHGPDLDVSSPYDWYGYYGVSWLTVAELLAYDYDQTFHDVEEDQDTTVRDFLGEWYFDRLAELAQLGPPEDVRVVFFFGS